MRLKIYIERQRGTERGSKGEKEIKDNHVGQRELFEARKRA